MDDGFHGCLRLSAEDEICHAVTKKHIAKAIHHRIGKELCPYLPSLASPLN